MYNNEVLRPCLWVVASTEADVVGKLMCCGNYFFVGWLYMVSWFSKE